MRTSTTWNFPRIRKNRRRKVLKRRFKFCSKFFGVKRNRFIATALAPKKKLATLTVVKQTPAIELPEVLVDTSWSIESYRNPFDTNSLWNLKKWFMELHKETIAEEELVTLAHAFASVQAYGCSYEPELMERLKQLGEPIAKVYHNLRRYKCSRILVPAEEAARMWQKRISFAAHLTELRRMQLPRLSPVFPACTLTTIFQNIVVVNNSLKETTEWFERLGGGTISIAKCQIKNGVYELKAYASNFFVTKATGPYKQAYSQCVADLLEILKNYCYQVNYTTQFPSLHYNVERLLIESDEPAVRCLRGNNIGYRMLQKLGWTGGPLGHKQTGILNPIEITIKHDRRGLGCNKHAKNKLVSKVRGCDCSLDIPFYQALMDLIPVRKPYYDIIFSPEFTETERIILTRLAVQRRIRCETRQSTTGQAQFVVKRFPLPPHEVLVQVLVKEHPYVLKYYDVIPPKIGFIPK